MDFNEWNKVNVNAESLLRFVREQGWETDVALASLGAALNLAFFEDCCNKCKKADSRTSMR